MAHKKSPYMTRTDVIVLARHEHGIKLTHADIEGDSVTGLTIDGMDWEDWLSAMTAA